MGILLEWYRPEVFDWVYIHSCGNGGYWFRPYGGSLGEAPSNQAPAPLTYGGSLRLAMPSLRSCSVGPPPSAIPGRGRLTRHPCRVAHYAEPPLGLPTGQIKIKSQAKAKARRPASRPVSITVRARLHCCGHSFRICTPPPCRSRLAGDGGGSVGAFIDWTDAIASKPAPTVDRIYPDTSAFTL